MNTELIAVDQVDEEFVNLVVVYNCFNMQDRELTKLIHDPRKSLADYMIGLPEPEKWSVSVNGELFDAGEWDAVYPAKDDFITVMPIPHGGNKGKSVLRIAAMVAIAVAAPYMVPATWGTVATSAAIAGINMAGAMVVNALLPMPNPSTPGYGDTSESSTYGVDGAKNTSTEQTSVPLIYGEYRYAGNMVNVKTENVDDTQIITSQIVVSEGPIESIGDFQVQDQPIANYEDVETITRLGVDNQAISSWFASSTRMVNKSVTLTTSHTTHLTTDVIDGFRVDLLFPSGLSEINKSDGRRLNRTVSFAIEYNRQGTSTWTSISPKQYRPLSGASILSSADKLRVEYQQRLTGTGSQSVTGNLFVRVGSGAWVLKQTKTHTVSLSSGSGFLSGAFNVDLDDMGSGAKSYKVEWTGASPTITASSRYAIEPTVTAKTGQPLRRSFDSPVLAQGIYNIRIRRLNDESTNDLITDRVTLTDVAEIINERVRYNHTAFYGVRIRLSDQLNGMPRITAKVKGIKVKHYDYSGRVTKTEWSNNPAWIALDMLTNRRYGAGLPLSRIDIRMFVEWAEFCSQQQFTFNGVFDSMTNIWDACQVVLRVGRARFVSVGNIYSLAIYRASEPVMMFGSGSIIEGSLQLSWQSLEDRANEFEIEYFDRENSNKSAIVRVVNEKALDRGEPQRISTLRMVGIDNQAQALKEAHFQKALNENLIMTGQFEATVESMACGVGDVVLIQHDMPDWGESGRIKPGSTRTLINVDRPLTLSASPNNMSFLILHPAVIRGTGVISNINTTNKIIYLTGLSTSIRGKRIKVGSKDLLVLSMSASGGYLEVVLESVSGLSVGNSVELWDTDVIETRAIQSYDAPNQQIRLSGPLSVDPQDFANYMVGKSNMAAKPVSITGISGTGEYKRMIKFIEYNATVFDPENAQPTPIYSRPITAVQHVRDLRVLEEVTMRTGSLTSDLVVSWSKPSDGNYAGAQVYMSRNGGPLLRHGTAAAGATVYHTTGVFGETMMFKVVAYDGAGRVADFDTAPIFEYSVVKSSDLPPVVKNFRATLGMDGVELMWDLIDDPDVVSYEIREGSSWAAGKVLVKKVASNRFFSTDKKHSYIYWIKATDVTGKQSPAASMATVVDLLKPAMPTSVDIEATSFAIKLMPNGLSPGALWEFRRSNVALATNMIESNAVKVGQSTVLVDNGLKHGTKYYYYIRGVNAFAVGDWYPVQATTKTDIPEILDALAGQVRESHLWGELNKRIDLIDGPSTLAGSVAKRIETEANARIAAITKEQGDRAAAISTETQARKDADSALTSSIASLTSVVNNNATLILNEQTARANADSALSTRVDAVLAKADANAASIVTESKARADGDSALTTQVNSVLAKANANAAAITSEATARANADNALSSTINTVSAKANSNASAISTETSARISADDALSSQITTAQSTLNGQISSVQQTLSTSISNVDKRVDGLADTTNLITNGSFYTGDTNGWTSVSSATSIIPGNDRGGSIAAKFVMQFPDDQGSYSPRSTSVPVRADEKFGVSFDMAHGNSGAANRMRAFVQWIDAKGSTVTTHYGITQNATFAWVRYGPHVFTAPPNATEARFGVQRLSGNAGVGFVTNVVANRVDAVLGAQYTLKLDVNGFVSGFGAYNDGTTSDFGVIANRFFVAAPGSTSGAMPFLVSGNSVYMNEAMIQTLTIGKLRTSTGGVVVENNRIKADYIDAANLDVRSSARFTGDVQSSNYSAGSAGWRIRQNGTAEFNQGVFNASLLVGDLSDNVTIAGVDSLGLIRQRAYAGSLSKDRVDNWTRPGSTLINGNSIFTGDAYVDTLQIKGRAVTIPFYMSGGYSSTNMRLKNGDDRADWHTFTSFFVEAGVTGGPANIFMEFSLAIRRFDRTNSSELVNVTNAEFRIIRRDSGSVIWSGDADTTTDSLIRHTTQGTIMRNTSVPAGGVWLDVQYHITYAWKYESASWNYSANEVYASPLRVSTMVSQR